MSARILAVCLGPGGIPKFPVESARCELLGLVGDGHRFRGHGGHLRAVCLFSIEDYLALEADGVRTNGPGTFGENLLIEGLDFRTLLAGDRLVAGAGEERVELELHDVREPCGTLKTLDARFPSLMLGRSGFVARVRRPGELRPGQRIAHEASLSSGT